MTDAKGTGNDESNYFGRYVIVFNAEKGAKALIDDRNKDKLSKGTNIMLKLLKDYDKLCECFYKFYQSLLESGYIQN